MNSSLELVTIAEFLHLTKLSPSVVLTLLGRGDLDSQFGPIGEILIDISTLSPERISQLAVDVGGGDTAPNEELIEELIASEIAAMIEPIVEDGLMLALDWMEEEPSTDDDAD